MQMQNELIVEVFLPVVLWDKYPMFVVKDKIFDYRMAK